MKDLTKRVLIGIVPIIAAGILLAADAPTIKIRDACEPATFNAPQPAGAGPGTCAEDFNGQVTFQKFIDQLTQHKTAPEWRFNRTQRTVPAGTRLLLDNYGGETHTFTRVENYGGGFVAPLNVLSGAVVLAPECFAQTVGSTFVAAGDDEKPGPMLQNSDRGKTVKFQCCIHPWMRTEIMVH